MSELVLYTTDDGCTRLDLRIEGETVWLTQLEIADLFQTTKQNVSLHAKNIFAEGELTDAATVKESLTVQTEGKRQVNRQIQLYNLDLILAIGYRVRSPRGTQFRQWATTHLREYLVKGFVMDDERLKNPGGWDYFDELLARIRKHDVIVAKRPTIYPSFPRAYPSFPRRRESIHLISAKISHSTTGAPMRIDCSGSTNAPSWMAPAPSATRP